MKQGPQRPSRDSLSRVQDEFERWRRRRTLGTRIPEELWRAAVEVGREQGVSKTALRLSLDYYALKERVESAPEERPAAGQPRGRGAGFVEIPLCAPPATPECILEVEDGQGGRLRVELKGAAPAELKTLVQALWSAAR